MWIRNISAIDVMNLEWIALLVYGRTAALHLSKIVLVVRIFFCIV